MDDKMLDWIDNAYALLQSSNEGFIARAPQIELSKAVALTLRDGTAKGGQVLVAEAPTGTGKTLGYLVGALAFKSTQDTAFPVVVATATKMLQDQIMKSDLPKLQRAGFALEPSAVALVKGAGNYLCLQRANALQDMLLQAESDPDVVLSPDDEEFSPGQVRDIVEQYQEFQWDGDFDHLRLARPRKVFPIAVSRDMCTRRKCQYFNQCAYFKARSMVEAATVAVSNQDLLLHEWLRDSENDDGSTSPLSGSPSIVFDEAHNLPEKAVSVGAFEVSLQHLEENLYKTRGVAALVKRHLPQHAALLKKLDSTAALATAAALTEYLEGLEVEVETSQRRFPRGDIPTELRTMSTQFMGELSALKSALEEVNGILMGDVELDKKTIFDFNKRVVDVKNALKGAIELFKLYAYPEKYVYWMWKAQPRITLHVSPLEGAQVLERLLWSRAPKRGVVMVSATLQSVNGFSRFAQAAGLGKNTTYKVLPHIFHYDRSQLIVRGMRNTPKPAERREFLTELKRRLPEDLSADNESALVLFSSWAMLKELAPVLKARLGEDVVKVQGEKGPPQLIADHKSDVDAGRPSILVGVATLAEGLDLPGAYCTHVAIISIPFAVPTDPLEKELADLLGNAYFRERSLPEATTRLLQWIGRLLRRESDVGRVSFYDRRLVSTGYGRDILRAMPPFTKVIEPA